MYDQIEKLGQSLIQSGPFNDRIYLMKLHPNDSPWIVERLDFLCRQHGFSKIFAKIPHSCRQPFEAHGFVEEATVSNMYQGKEDAVFLARYLDLARAQETKPQRVTEIIELSQAKACEHRREAIGEVVGVERATKDDIVEMSQIYRTVFASYPFPIHDPEYLKETLKTNVRYFCVREEQHIIALSSAEMDSKSKCVEMTDFATLPPFRGRGLASALLNHMEKDMLGDGILTAYTIARALSPGMNITFATAGYAFGGTLTNNTNISGNIESMNVWYKHLLTAQAQQGVSKRDLPAVIRQES